MEQFFELLKYTIPGLIVFAATYLTLKSYMDAHYRDLTFSKQIESQKIALPIRLQAFERLMLLCDRLQLENMLLRVRNTGMAASDLRMALMVTISQEFDHNASQQLYVSDTLWKILQVAKNDTMELVTRAYEGLNATDPDEKLIQRLFMAQDQLGGSQWVKVQSAIRTEAGKWIN
jgi:hypothetical protein